ncbi:MAG TPA: hypothetical protein VL306_03410 [Methylomirabilota bacterium]|jgi:hypothetical protein|nr:hypothetical protein [Methylomirabilota bacterium]
MKKKLEYKILGYAYLILIFAAIVAVISYFQIPDFDFQNITVHPRTNQNLTTYTNDKYALQIQYPKTDEFVLSSKDSAVENFFRTNGQSLASISLPQTAYPKTNFGSARVNIAVREGTFVENCIYYFNGSTTSNTLDGSAIVNRNPAFTTEFTDAAAGTQYETHLYHIPHNNICYEISLTVGTGNIDNYPAGTVSEVNKADVWNKLNSILNTFKFTK